MPNRKKADLIIHPTRLQILQALAEAPHTTQEIARLLPALPVPSLYRHLKALLEGGIVEVVETRRVRGIDEKVYRLAQAPRINAEDASGMSRDEHLGYFSTYVASLINDFAAYLDATYQAAAEAGLDEPDFVADRAGYTEMTYYASMEELDAFREQLARLLIQLTSQLPASGRSRRKLAFISHPLPGKSGKPTDLKSSQ
jgi:DNA-binding transcriptional ArsR family regulator